jgi:hypothetical protein
MRKPRSDGARSAANAGGGASNDVASRRSNPAMTDNADAASSTVVAIGPI